MATQAVAVSSTGEELDALGEHASPDESSIEDNAPESELSAERLDSPSTACDVDARALLESAFTAPAAEKVETGDETRRKRLGMTVEELLSLAAEEINWLVPSLLVKGWTLQIAGREKTAGKGTFTYYLLSRLAREQRTVFGESGSAVTALIITEEPVESVREKIEAFGLGRARVIMDYELAGRAWEEKIAAVVAEAVADGHGVLFADNISRLAGIQDESGVELARAVERLQAACRAAGLSLIYDHHHKKGRDTIENKGRGGTALAGAADVILDIERVGGRGSRKRRLTARGRLRSVNWQRTVELLADGTDYISTDDPAVDGEADAEKRAEGKLFWALLKLRELVIDKGCPVTAVEFATAIGKSRQVAMDRLNGLVTEGLAVKHTDYTPYTFGPVATDETETASD